ncbi:hypothetical protein ONZ43_g7287 [Nemania bipapillata]|uniref:Uncharacterized protein n=1 Tax=Nemania bipapillata TaxID=110536 RepID=A0ACC2HTB8_9PEZI|nr:hypothetical protein ONZ43_g7287 [Nemania bipapillata]
MAVNSTTSHPPPQFPPNASSDLTRGALPSPCITTPTATPAATIDLTQHSLHAVLNRDKTLWKTPMRWTRAHLLALGVQHSCRSRCCGHSEQEGGYDRSDGDDEEIHHVVLPKPNEKDWDEKVNRTIKTASVYSGRVNALAKLLYGVVYRPFTTLWTTPVLAVGSRKHVLLLMYHFLLNDEIVFPYIDSDILSHLRHVESLCDQTCPYEPYITAVLISRAQTLRQPSCSNRSGTGDKNTESNTDPNRPITTRLLYTHRDDGGYMHVYTAHISHALLDRFQHLNQPPATPSTDPLIRLDHRRIPFEPRDTFRQRLLAAVSMIAVVETTAAPSRKRPPSPDSQRDTIKPLSPHRHPLYGIDVNNQRY